MSVINDENNIKVIVGFPPGGSLDLTATPLVESVNRNKILPGAVEIVYEPGKSGTIGMEKLLGSEPSGEVLCVGAMGLLTLQPHLRSLPYQNADDYTPILGLVNNPVCLAVKADAPWTDLKEFIEDARKKPGKIRVGDLGKGSALHLATEQLNLSAEIALLPTHLSGSPECLRALLAGEVDCITNHHAVFPELVENGKVRVLGVFEKSRNSLFPESPTFIEIGYDLIFDSYACLIGPKGMDETMISILHDAFSEAMNDSVFIEKMAERGLDLYYKNPNELRSILLKDYDQNLEVIRTIGLSVEN